MSYFSEVFVSNKIATDWATCFAASHLGLLCMPMSHKEDARLKWLKFTKVAERPPFGLSC